MDRVELVVFVTMFALVTGLGFVAARWRSGDLSTINEWGLGGRRFGLVISWFLIGGDYYSAQALISVPALAYGIGAPAFFIVPYVTLVYPFVFMVMPRLWTVAKEHGYITSADYVLGRYGSRRLAFLVAVVGIFAVMPQIALQLVGMQVVIAALGIGGSGAFADLPLIIAFLVLATYTWYSGLRAPALIAIVKDIMIYVSILAAVIIIPMKLGGFGHMFSMVDAAFLKRLPPADFILQPHSYSGYVTTIIGSALGAFLLPNLLIAIFAAESRSVIRRNAALLPAYNLLLAFVVLLGYMAIARGVKPVNTSSTVPLLFAISFPPWFVGFAFAALAISALVPAAVMSIGAGTLYGRIHRELRPNRSGEAAARAVKLFSFFVKLGALAFVIYLPTQYVIQMSLIGFVWVLQTFPAIILGLFTRFFHRDALVVGMITGLIIGTAMVASLGWKQTIFPLQLGAIVLPGFAGFYALLVNIAASAIATPIMDALRKDRGEDETTLRASATLVARGTP